MMNKARPDSADPAQALAHYDQIYRFKEIIVAAGGKGLLDGIAGFVMGRNK